MIDDLQKLRSKIDTLDAELLNIVALRMAEVKQIGIIKKGRSLPLLDESRWVKILQDREKLGAELGLSSKFIDKLFDAIHEYALEIENEVSE